MAKYKSEVGKILSAAARKAKERLRKAKELKESKELKKLKKPKTESTLGRRGQASGRRSEDIVSDVARSDRIRAKLGLPPISRTRPGGPERTIQESKGMKKPSVGVVEGTKPTETYATSKLVDRKTLKLKKDPKHTERVRRDRKIHEDTKKKLKEFKKLGKPDERSGVERRKPPRPQHEAKLKKKKKKPQESQSPHGEVKTMSASEYRKLTEKKKGFE